MIFMMVSDFRFSGLTAYSFRTSSDIMIFWGFRQSARISILSKLTIFLLVRMLKCLSAFLYSTNHSTTSFFSAASKRIIENDLILILWRWLVFHQLRNHRLVRFLYAELRTRFKFTIYVKTISCVDKIPCINSDLIRWWITLDFSSFNILFCPPFCCPESRRRETLNVL